MTTTALATVKRDTFLALGGAGKELAEAMESVAGIETFGPDDVTRVKVPSAGGTNWTIPGIAGDETTEAITGVLCYVQKRGTLWPSDEPQEGSQPVLVTYDLQTAEQVGPIPDDMVDVLEKYRIDDRHFRWADLPYNQFGSGKNNSKRCREQRLLFILRPGDLYPMVVNCPPGSLRNVRQFILRLPQATKLPFWHSVVELRLEKTRNNAGQPFSRITPKLTGVLSKEDGALVKSRYFDPLSKFAVQIADDEDSPADE